MWCTEVEERLANDYVIQKSSAKRVLDKKPNLLFCFLVCQIRPQILQNIFHYSDVKIDFAIFRRVKIS